MSIRHLIATKQRLAATIAIGATLCAAAALIYTQRGYQSMAPPSRLFYSDDDGVSFFPDASTQITPFQHNGKTAVIAHVFSSDGGKTKWVGYLERNPPWVKEKIDSGESIRDARYLVEVKLPQNASARWTEKLNSDAGREISQPNPPKGAQGTPEEMFP